MRSPRLSYFEAQRSGDNPGHNICACRSEQRTVDRQPERNSENFTENWYTNDARKGYQEVVETLRKEEQKSNSF